LTVFAQPEHADMSKQQKKKGTSTDDTLFAIIISLHLDLVLNNLVIKLGEKFRGRIGAVKPSAAIVPRHRTSEDTTRTPEMIMLCTE